MPASIQSRGRLLCLYRILLKYSDEEHPLTIPQLQEKLEEYGCRVERKCLYQDLHTLIALDVDVQNQKGYAPGWYLASRPFRPSELMLLCDAIRAVPFLSPETSQRLTDTLHGLASCHQVKTLRRHSGCAAKKSDDDGLFLSNLDKLFTALSRQRAIRFRLSGLTHPHESGFWHTASVLDLLWQENGYQVKTFHHIRCDILCVPVEQLHQLTVTDLPARTP